LTPSKKKIKNIAIYLNDDDEEEEEDDEKENRETSPSIKTTSFITKEREALSANDTNTSADISGINSLDISKADSTKDSEKSKLKVSMDFYGKTLILNL